MGEAGSARKGGPCEPLYGGWTVMVKGFREGIARRRAALISGAK